MCFNSKSSFVKLTFKIYFIKSIFGFKLDKVTIEKLAMIFSILYGVGKAFVKYLILYNTRLYVKYTKNKLLYTIMPSLLYIM